VRVTAAPVPTLASWGVSPDADLVYRRLVTFGRAPAATLTRELGLPSRRLRRALDELADLGAAGRTHRHGAVVWAAGPVAEVMATLRTPRHRLAPVAEALEQAAQLGDGIRHLRTRAMTRTRLAELAAVARHEHLAMNPEPAFEAESARPAVAMDRKLLERGVEMRVLGVQVGDPDPMTQHGRTPDDSTPAYRRAATVPMKLFVVDRAVAIFPVTPSDLSHGYLEVRHPPIVAALTAVFEQHWTESRMPEEPRMPKIALEPREQALIELLAQGHTDASAAQELHISVRSVSATVRTLMDRFSVDNRFQLGVALGLRRLAAPPAGPAAGSPGAGPGGSG
jgi:DNA-binding CsgD family transcriptional regulator